ncbi:class I SAM-dependent methyltransferase [Bacillus sp. Bva_UNVM-123]|uniref:class I SAM-dependent methyltransferase n=1 Tax=Bacillus sp. Bva_UNVM-123 TaxID=2829798 RepID=UPI00391EEE2D
MNRLEHIRREEKKYHDECYKKYKLFEKGSWLHKPVQSVIELLPFFHYQESVKVLDLGCGVGRNSIPIAKAIKSDGGEVVCVDLLDSALNKLAQYSKEHGVEDVISPVKSDIGSFQIESEEYDFIVAVSSLEHVQSESMLEAVVRRMIKGTKYNGINCIIINTEIEEIDMQTGEKLETFMEVNLSTEEMLSKMENHYYGWKVLKKTIKPLEYSITRNEQSIRLKTNAITYIFRKNDLSG